MDPYRACLGLARAARREGAQIFENSAVERIDTPPYAGAVTLRTSRGRIDADRVIVATGYAAPFLESIAGKFRLNVFWSR